MTHEQLSKLKFKINCKVKEIERQKLGATIRTSFIERINYMKEHIELLNAWYNSHEETPPTEKECNLGVDWLRSQDLTYGTHYFSETVIAWFIDSYGIDVPQKEFTYRDSIDLTTNINFSKSDDYQYT